MLLLSSFIFLFFSSFVDALTCYQQYLISNNNWYDIRQTSGVGCNGSCSYIYQYSEDKIVIRGCIYSKFDGCTTYDWHKACSCRTDFCNTHEFCYISSDKTAVCESHCSTKIQPYKDRHGFNITKGCSERKEEGCFKENDGSVSCYCYGHKCNAPTYAVKCYEFRFNDVKLIDCPNPSKQCYYVRDPTTMKTIDGGCDLQVGNKPKCSGDGCNYPMSCYDYKTDSVIQCSDSVRTCQVIYEKNDKCDVKTAIGSCGIQNDPAVPPSVNETVCQMNGTDIKQCICTGDMCNYPINFVPMFCYNDTSSDTVINCPFGTTHCYIFADATTGKTLKKGCSVFHQENKCKVENNVRTCICKGDKCNVRECYIFNGTMPAKLEACSHETAECYVARDPQTLKLIEAGCYRQNLGDYKIQKCDQNGCNYPMFCHDFELNDAVQCEANVTSCFVNFENVDGYEMKISSGCNSNDRLESGPQNIHCEMDGKGDKNCVCSGDMCNHERNFDSVSCFTSSDTGSEVLTKCPMDTTHCYANWDKNNGAKMGCSILDEKEGCRMENNKKICICQGDGCNRNILNVKCFASNITTPARLEICPYEAFECYSIRDSKSLKTIETGCGVSQNKSAEMCSGNGCNYPMHCHTGLDVLIQCPMDTTHCYANWDKNNGTRMGCSVLDEKEGCRMENGKKICICQGDVCNRDILNIKCFVSDITAPAELEVCPYEAFECYFIRDPESLKTIEIGCGVSQNKNAKMCPENGCNYPHHCYDRKTNGTQQCAQDVTTCYTIFEGDYHKSKVSSGCDGRAVNLPTPINGLECRLEGSKKYCSCSGDMCNYEKNFELTKCTISDGKDNDVIETCPVFTTHCFYKRDINTERIIQKNCLIFEETREGCVVQDGVETCKCVGDGCNSEILLDTSLPFAKLYRYAVYSHLT